MPVLEEVLAGVLTPVLHGVLEGGVGLGEGGLKRPPNLWTPNLNGINSYGLLVSDLVFGNTDDFTLSVTFYPTDDGNADLLYSSSVVGDNFTQRSADTTMFSDVGGGNFAGTDLSAINAIHTFVITSVGGATTASLNGGTPYSLGNVTDMSIGVLANYWTFANAFPGQLPSFIYDNTSVPSRSALVNTIINSETMPTELGIYNELAPSGGPNLCTNGTFDGNDTTGWVAFGDVTLQAIGEELIYDKNPAAVLSGLNYYFTSVIGQKYKFSVDISGHTGNGAAIRALDNHGTTNAGIIKSVTGITSDGLHEIVFTATTTTTQFRLTNGASGSITYYEADNINIQISNKIGDWFNLGTDQPYVPVLKNGSQDRITYDPNKYEAYCGSYSDTTFTNGVSTIDKYITQLGTQVGSNLGNVGTTPALDDIIVAKNGAVIKFDEIVDGANFGYAILQGDDAAIQVGHEYPNVTRVLKDSGGSNNSDEWWYYDNGGTYPWTPPVLAPYDWTPNLNGVNSYGILSSAWNPVDPTWDVVVDFFLQGPYDANSHTFIDSGTATPSGDRLLIYLLGTTWKLGYFGRYSNVELDGVPVSNDSTPVTVPALSRITADGNQTNANLGVQNIAVRHDESVSFFIGQIHNIELNNPSSPPNSIEINTIINSEDMPTDTGIYNELPSLFGPNDLLYSEQFESSYWAAKTNTTTDNDILAPDGTMTGCRVNETVIAGYHNVQRLSIVPITTGRGVWRAHVKKGTRQYCCFSINNVTSSTVTTAIFDFDGGVFSLVGASLLATATALSDGWWKIEWYLADSKDNDRFSVGLSTGPTRADTVYTGDTAEYMYIWGFQKWHSALSDATAYVKTEGTAAPAILQAGNHSGDWFNLGAPDAQPYVPVLKNGEPDRVTYNANKYEVYNGVHTSGNFVNGVDTTGAQISSLGTQVGSWLGAAGTTPAATDIIVAKSGSVIQVVSAADANTINYVILQGDDAAVQAGHEYPNVTRVLTDDGGVDAASEYWWFNNGNTVPW